MIYGYCRISTGKQSIERQIRNIKAALTNQLSMTGDDVDIILKGINEYLMRLAEKQIEIAFEQAQKEVDDLRQRTKEGIETARLNGKQIGRITGKRCVTKKEIEAKKQIVKYSKDFDGTLKDVDVIRRIGIAKGSYYKYKNELMSEY